jgi:hypothetical protein
MAAPETARSLAMSDWATAVAFLLTIPIGWLLARLIAHRMGAASGGRRASMPIEGWSAYAEQLSDADRALVVRSSRRGEAVPPALAGAAAAYCRELLTRLDDPRQRLSLYTGLSLVAGVGAILVARSAARPAAGVVAFIALAVVVFALLEVSARLVRRRLVRALHANETSSDR